MDKQGDMANNKYIGTKEVVRLTGLSMNEVYDLIHLKHTWKRFATKANEDKMRNRMYNK